MRPIQFRLRIPALLAALSATALFSVALSAAPAATVPVAEEAATHDHAHTVTGAAGKQDGAASDDMMQQMRAMHAKMRAAKTAEERMALMPGQQAMMQSGMTMMQNMQSQSAGCMAQSSSGSTTQRMDMMQMMMQMMTDRMSMPGADVQKPDAQK